MTVWSIEEAINLIRHIQPALSRVGWCVGLTGSVLGAGRSEKDLDLILYPHSQKSDIKALHEALIGMGFVISVPVEEVHKKWRSVGSDDTKNVSIWKFQGKRVDIFVLG